MCLCLPDWQQVETRHKHKRPLNDDQRKYIDVNRCKLVKVIDPNSGIIDQLHANKCFNSQHKDHIECGMNTSNKSERLLDIMRRRSVASFNKLIDALNTGGYKYVAEILQRAGGKLVYMKYTDYVNMQLFVLRSR